MVEGRRFSTKSGLVSLRTSFTFMTSHHSRVQWRHFGVAPYIPSRRPILQVGGDAVVADLLRYERGMSNVWLRYGRRIGRGSTPARWWCSTQVSDCRGILLPPPPGTGCADHVSRREYSLERVFECVFHVVRPASLRFGWWSSRVIVQRWTSITTEGPTF